MWTLPASKHREWLDQISHIPVTLAVIWRYMCVNWVSAVFEDLSLVISDWQKAERKRLREVLFLRAHPDKRIDYVIAYEDTDDENKLAKRESYRENLLKEGIMIEDETKTVGDNEITMAKIVLVTSHEGHDVSDR